MNSLGSTCNRTWMEDLAKDEERLRRSRPSAREETEAANAKQLELLYGGNESKWGCCVFCGSRKKNGGPCNRNDHYMSLILAGGIPSMYGNHPLNMVFCCTECNNEKKKERLMETRVDLRAYREYLERSCPRLPFSQEECIAQFAEFKRICGGWAEKRKSMQRVPYVEDIDAP